MNKMTYEEYLIDIFFEDQLAYGQDEEEIKDWIEEYGLKKIEKYLRKCGYELDNWEDLIVYPTAL